MERFFRVSLTLFTVLFVAALFTVTGCSDDDNPTDPNPIDTTDNNDTTGNGTIDDKVRPVVFVHGFIEAADVYTQMTQLFALNGYTNDQIHAFDLVDYLSGSEPDIAVMASQISAKVDEVLNGSSEDRVDIVAHGAGVEALQHYLVNMSGTEKLAHVVFAGGRYDMGLTVSGDVTPSPCKYLTLRSDGADDLQNGNPSYGELGGATNELLAGFDNLELVTHPDAFAEVYAFFTGSQPDVTSFPNPRPGDTYNVRARVINFIDNTPLAEMNVTVVNVRVLSSGEIQRQSGAESFTTDGEGYFSYDASLGPDHYTEFWIRSLTGQHFDMHIYVQPWRTDVATLRLRLIPKSSGSDLLRDFGSSMRVGDHSIYLMFSQNTVLEENDDNLVMARYDTKYELISEVDVLTPGNAPAAGAGGAAGNTFMLAVLDYDQNQQDGTGPIQASGLNTFGINSFDAYLAGKPTNHQTRVTLNGRTIGAQNFASNGGLGASNGGFSLIHFEY